jgi:hypothetical protein
MSESNSNRHVRRWLILVVQKEKLKRWIEIASPYINYPCSSAVPMYVDMLPLFARSSHLSFNIVQSIEHKKVQRSTSSNRPLCRVGMRFLLALICSLRCVRVCSFDSIVVFLCSCQL